MHRQASVGTILETIDPQARIGSIALAQVVGVTPQDHTIQVLFMTGMGILDGAGPLAVKVLQRRAGTGGAILELPQRGEWGLVAFPHGSSQMAVWLGAIAQDLSNLAWQGIGATTRLDQHDSGVYSLLDDAGNLDTVFPDGTFLRVGVGATPSSRLRYERQGVTKRNAVFTNPAGPPATVTVHHSSGSVVQIDPTGNITVTGVGDITVQGPGTTLLKGGGAAKTVLGGAPDDLIVLLQGLLNLNTWLTAHTHGGVKGGTDTSGPPSAPPTPPVAGTDYTINTVAS